MSSDADYAAFLEKANQDTGAGNVSARSERAGTKAVNTQVPASLQAIDEFYTSDADEPFEPVSLQWSADGIPSTDELASLIGHDGKITALSEREFDPHGQYGRVISAVSKAGGGEVSMFRLEIGGTRCEYYVVSLDKAGGRLVGLKALAVES